MELRHEDIAKLAYRFYIEDGKPVGQALDHWARAEAFLRHPENHSDGNLLSPPSEPEINRALDEKGRELDRGLPSDPRSGEEAVHQWVEIAMEDPKKRRDAKNLPVALKRLKGIERIQTATSGRVRIYFDARRTNPAAIHEAIVDHEDELAAEQDDR